MSLADLVNEAAALRADREEAIKRHDRLMHQIDTKLSENALQQKALRFGVTTETLALARSVISVRGTGALGSNRKGVVRDAMDALANGGGALHSRFFGTKNYDGWIDQRCDCNYGYGPKHGSIVFSVGLVKPNTELSQEQIEAALLVLSAVLEGLDINAKVPA